jgi:hypothetical protein
LRSSRSCCSRPDADLRSLTSSRAQTAGVRLLVDRSSSTWTEDGSQLLEPPQELIAAANAIGFRSPRLESRGYEQLEERVTKAYDEFVDSGQYRFRRRDNTSRLDDVLKFGWEMVPADSDQVVAIGLEIAMLAPDGRIRTDYQFIEQ